MGWPVRWAPVYTLPRALSLHTWGLTLRNLSYAFHHLETDRLFLRGQRHAFAFALAPDESNPGTRFDFTRDASIRHTRSRTRRPTCADTPGTRGEPARAP